MKKTQAIVTIWGGRGSQPRESEPPVTLRLICQPQEDTKICSGQQLVESEKGSKMQLFAEESVASGATKGQQNGAVRAAVKQQLEGVAAAGKTADEAAVRAVEKQQFGAIVADVKSPTVAAVGGAENGGNVQPKLRGHGSNLQRLHTDTLGCLRSKASKDPPMLVDIFVNYDCGLDAPNLFERMVTTLSKIAQGTQTTDPSSVVGSQNVSIKGFSLQCLVNVLKSLVDWEESHWVHA